MAPRTYNANLVLPAAPRPPLRVVEQQRIPKDAKLLGVANASKALNERLDGGYSTARIYRMVSSGEWVEGVHFARDGRGKGARILIYVDAVVEWVINPKG